MIWMMHLSYGAALHCIRYTIIRTPSINLLQHNPALPILCFTSLSTHQTSTHKKRNPFTSVSRREKNPLVKTTNQTEEQKQKQKSPLPYLNSLTPSKPTNSRNKPSLPACYKNPLNSNQTPKPPRVRLKPASLLSKKEKKNF